VSAISARFFEWVQNATFYADLHREAVELTLATMATPAPSWVDVGCGPGLLARLAAEQGARVEGIDTDPAMVRAARRHPTTARFELGDAGELPAASADVVSAASVLYGASDPTSMVATLWAAVRPGGALLLVETTPAMTIDAARRISPVLPRHHRRALYLWARSRYGHTFDHSALDQLPTQHRTRHKLLHDLVEAIIAVKPASQC
jgi:ubiquinone/menaquinone biosynthesis C-methylase UbiE